MTDSETKKKIQENMIGLYFSRPRKDSPRRFLKRLMTPRKFRFQSLLRGAMASAKKERRECKCNERTKLLGTKHSPGACERDKNRNADRRLRQGRTQIETDVKRAEIRTKR